MEDIVRVTNRGERIWRCVPGPDGVPLKTAPASNVVGWRDWSEATVEISIFFPFDTEVWFV